MPLILNRIGPANRVLSLLREGSALETRDDKRGRKRLWIKIPGHDRVLYRTWQTRGQDFYPTWHRKWPGGGTSMIALSQMVRWVQGKNVLPLSTWEYWCGERVKLFQDTQVLEILREAHYPEVVNCCLCGEPVRSVFDWWSLGGDQGPCCTRNYGCCQEILET